MSMYAASMVNVNVIMRFKLFSIVSSRIDFSVLASHPSQWTANPPFHPERKFLLLVLLWAAWFSLQHFVRPVKSEAQFSRLP